jgi:hypothetical protein
LTSVGSEPKLGSAWFWLELLGKKLPSAWLTMPLKKLGSACHILQKSSVQPGLLYDLKNRVTLKTKNELISNIFANFLRYDREDINKSVLPFFYQKVIFFKKSQLKIVQNCSILENRKLCLARF